jgi:glutamine synthetase
VLVHAICDGIGRGLTLDSVLIGHIDDEEFNALPVDLAGAITAFNNDDIARGWFPANLVEVALAVRQGELETLRGLDMQERCQAYVERY